LGHAAELARADDAATDVHTRLRRRTKVIGRFPGKTSALSLI
jgi:hypothetical protein